MSSKSLHGLWSDPRNHQVLTLLRFIKNKQFTKSRILLQFSFWVYSRLESSGAVYPGCQIGYKTSYKYCYYACMWILSENFHSFLPPLRSLPCMHACILVFFFLLFLLVFSCLHPHYQKKPWINYDLNRENFHTQPSRSHRFFIAPKKDNPESSNPQEPTYWVHLHLVSPRCQVPRKPVMGFKILKIYILIFIICMISTL